MDFTSLTIPARAAARPLEADRTPAMNQSLVTVLPLAADRPLSKARGFQIRKTYIIRERLLSITLKIIITKIAAEIILTYPARAPRETQTGRPAPKTQICFRKPTRIIAPISETARRPRIIAPILGIAVFRRTLVMKPPFDKAKEPGMA